MRKKNVTSSKYRKVKISNKNINKKNKQEYAKLIVLAIFLIIVTIGGSYALFKTTIKGTKQTEVVAGTLKVEYEDKNTIKLNNTSPLTDEEGLNQEPYTFTVKNIGTLNGKYTIYLEEKEGNTLDKSNIKYSIKEGDGSWSSPVLLSSGLILKENRILESNKEETYQIKMWLKEDSPNEVQGQTYSAKVVVDVVQTNVENIVTTNPIIKLNGESVVKVNQNDEYTDAGIDSVSSNEKIDTSSVKVRYEYSDGINTIDTNTIDTSRVGIYYIYYEVEDSKGIKGVATRVVNVIKKGVNIPTITLKGEEEIVLDYKEKYIEAGYTARDEEDGELTDKVVVEGVVNSEVAGTYIIKYIIIDSEGNTASIVRKVIVNKKTSSFNATVTKKEIENISAVITIKSEENEGYYAISSLDKKPGDSEYKKIEETTEVNVVKNGRYYVYIKSKTGNVIKKIIDVTNIDETKPTCSFSGESYLQKNESKVITLTCTDPADIVTKTITKEMLEISDDSVGEIENITAGEKIEKGYQYKISIKGKTAGSLNLKLKDNNILDRVGNSNEITESSTIKVVEMIIKEKTVKLDLSGIIEKQIEISGTNIGKLTYKSDNEDVAVVTDNGLIKAVAEGKATITVTESNGKITEKITVIVVRKVKATFNKNGVGVKTIGATTASCEIEEVSGKCSILMPTIETNSGYSAIGWNINKNATDGYNQLEEVEIEKDTNFYSISKKDAITLKATFNKNGAVSLDGKTDDKIIKTCTLEEVYNDEQQKDSCKVITPTIEASSNTPIVLGYNTSSSATLATVNQNTSISLSNNQTYYAITKKEAIAFTANWNANGATLSTTTQSSCNIAATYNGEKQATSCTVNAPTITAPTATPTVLGYNTSENSNSNNSNYDVTSKLLTLNSSNTGKTWYAQTKKEAVSYTISSYEKGSNISSIGTKTDTNSECTIAATYNGVAQGTSCTVTTPTITANTGYTSVGWNLTKGATTGSSVITLNSSNTGKVWYANATANSYTINYYDGTTLKGSSSAKVDTYPTLTKASSLSLSKTGYTFKGWATTNGGAVVYTDGQKLTSNLATTAGATVNLYAVWKDETAPVCSFSGASATTTQNTTSITLSCTDSGSGVVQKTLATTDFTTTANGSVTAVGAPTKITNGYSYTVTLNGLSVGTFTVSLKAGLISDTAGNSNAAVTSGNVTVNGRTYTVTFSKGSNVSAISSTSSACTTTGSSLTCTIGTYPTITAATGYSPSTWYDSTAKKDTGIASGGSGSGYAISQNTTMTAQAKANTYKIYFSANGGTGAPSPIIRTYGKDVTFPSTVPTKTGYTFNGWLYYGTGDSSSTATTTATQGSYGAGAVSSSSCTTCIPWNTSDTTYVATWSPNTYTIKYDANGGTGAPADQSFVYNSGARISETTPTRTGYTFVNWKYGDSTFNPGDAVPTGWGDFTLQAQWSINSYYYNVNPDSGIASFDIAGAVNSSTGLTDYYQKNPYGQEVTITNVKAKPGYTYTGYTLSGNLTSLSGSTNTMIKTKLGAGNGTIALNSKINSYTVTYDKNGGDSVSKASASVNYGSDIDLTPTASKSGYEFIGWNTSASSTTALSSLKMGISNVTLYAIYKKIVTIPTSSLCTNPTYNGDSQQLTSVTSGDGYMLSGYTGTDAKSYTIIASLSGFAKWSDDTTGNKTFSCSIGKKSITVTADSSSKTYDGSALTNTSGCSITSGSVLTGHSVTCSNSGSVTNKGSVTNTLSSVVINSGTTDVSGNYAITKKNGTLTINAKTITCTSGSSSKPYDGKALTNATGGSCTNLVSGHTATFSGHTGSITNVGTAPNTFGSVVIKNGTTDVSGNYAITKKNGTLTVTKIDATNPTLSAYTGVYDGTSHTIGVSGGSGGTIEYSTDNKTWTTAKPTRTDVGTTTVYVRVTGDSNHNTTTAISSTITITRKPISLPTCGSKTYTGASQTLFTSTTEYTAGGTTSGIDAGAYTSTATPTGNYMWTDKTTTAKNVACTINPKSVAVSWGATTSFTYNGSAQAPSASASSGISGETINITRTTATNAGSYTSTASCSSVSGGRAKCGNYSLSGATKGFSITKDIIQKPSSPAARDYNGSAMSSNISCPAGSTTSGTTSATNAGTYSQTCTPDSNHQWKDGTTTAASISWVINKVAATLTCSNKTYNGASQTGCSCSGGTIGGTYSAIDAGTYTASCTADSNHTSPSNKSWTISPKSVAVSWGTTTSFTMNSLEQGPSASATSGISGETINVESTKAIGVGNYTSTASCSSVSGGRAKCNNYSLTGTTKGFSIYGITRTATFDANGNTLSTPSGCSASGSNRVCSCKTTGTSTSCSITAPTITAPANTPTVCGFTNSSNETTSCSIGSGATITLSSNPTYYAQTYKGAVDYKITWNANGATIGATTSSCTADTTYNGTAQGGCNITSPTITRTGYTIYGWNTSSSATTSSWNVGTTRTISSNATYYAITKDTTPPSAPTIYRGYHVFNRSPHTISCSNCTLTKQDDNSYNVRNTATNSRIIMKLGYSIKNSVGYIQSINPHAMNNLYYRIFYNTSGTTFTSSSNYTTLNKLFIDYVKNKDRENENRFEYAPFNKSIDLGGGDIVGGTQSAIRMDIIKEDSSGQVTPISYNLGAGYVVASPGQGEDLQNANILVLAERDSVENSDNGSGFDRVECTYGNTTKELDVRDAYHRVGTNSDTASVTGHYFYIKNFEYSSSETQKITCNTYDKAGNKSADVSFSILNLKSK